MSLPSYIQQRLGALKKKHLWRSLFGIQSRASDHFYLDNQSLINFSSNDYLNLSTHPEVKKAFSQAALTWGLGSGASAQICGYTTAHQKLEQQFAAFMQRERALLFNSGYHANLGILTSFADRHTWVIADKLCHASLIDGMVLSRTHFMRYPHLDMQQAASLLSAAATSPKLLISESIFSMQGDLAPVKELVRLAKQHQAFFIMDDAHGFGCLGANGRGIIESAQLNSSDLPCLVTPLGKALGSMGAMVSGSAELIEALVQLARPHRYSTALAPAVCEASCSALRLLQRETWRREQLHALIQFFNQAAAQRGLALYSTDLTPIKSILIGNNQDAIHLHHKLKLRGFFVSAIRPPTVPTHDACIRISLCSGHTEAHINDLLDCLHDELDLIRTEPRNE